jgi:hypothetical protein
MVAKLARSKTCRTRHGEVLTRSHEDATIERTCGQAFFRSRGHKEWLYGKVPLLERRWIVEIAALMRPTDIVLIADKKPRSICQPLESSCTNSSYITSLPKDDYGAR